MLMGLTFTFKHPEVKPALLTHFEPWFPLLWTDGSIGAISTADLTTGELKSFTGNEDRISYIEKKDMQTGSNGFFLQPKQLQEMRFFTSIPILLFISDLKYR
jgi:hypothetical protein